MSFTHAVPSPTRSPWKISMNETALNARTI
jgi:hypothetical protein